MLRAGRIHGRPGSRAEDIARGQGPVDVGLRQAEKVRVAHDQAGQPVPTGVADGRRAPAVRGARARPSGHRHIPRRSHCGGGQPDVPETGVAQRTGENTRGPQVAVL